MNAIALHITDNLCHRIPDTPVVYSDIAYLSAVTERLQCCLAYIMGGKTKRAMLSERSEVGSRDVSVSYGAMS